MSSLDSSPAKSKIEHLQRDIEKNLMTQIAISSILRISLEPIPIDEQLHRILDLMVQLPLALHRRQGLHLPVRRGLGGPFTLRRAAIWCC